MRLLQMTRMKARPEEMVGLFQTGSPLIELEPPQTWRAPEKSPGPSWLAVNRGQAQPPPKPARWEGRPGQTPAVESTEGGVIQVDGPQGRPISIIPGRRRQAELVRHLPRQSTPRPGRHSLSS